MLLEVPKCSVKVGVVHAKGLAQPAGHVRMVTQDFWNILWVFGMLECLVRFAAGEQEPG